MGACSYLAKQLDVGMLEVKGVPIAAVGTPARELPRLSGAELGQQLCGRILLHYLLDEYDRTILEGTDRLVYVTPTPYAPAETIFWLNLSFRPKQRRYVLLLRPEPLYEVAGPRWIAPGGIGIEYLLLSGFPAEAIVEMSHDRLGRPGRWPLEVR